MTLPLPQLTEADLEALDQLRLAQVRDSFREYRVYMRPELRWNWWTKLVAYHLQKFFTKLQAGQRPKLVLNSPPQHGKSLTAEDFIAWAAGRDPKLKVIFASYSDDLGVGRNRNLQRIWQSPEFQAAFPNFRIGGHGLTCNSSMIEFANADHVPQGGSFTNTTVESGINGMELMLGVIDDPHKGRAEALSPATRTRVWNWFTDDWMPRFHKNSGMLIIATRWHVDDMMGRYLAKEHDVTVVSYPAIAEADEPFRQAGEALFPSVKPLDHLLERKKLMSRASWASEYQQHPIVVGGGIIPIEKLRIIPMMPALDQIKRTVRYVDKAGSHGEGAYTAMVLMSMLKDGTFLIEDVIRGQWSALEREATLLKVANMDRQRHPRFYEVVVEQEPGSGGKESAEASLRMLRGFRCFADKVTGSKDIRAEPFAAQVQGSNVWMVAGRWNDDFIDEAEGWPNSKFRDQVDAAAGAFNRMTSKPAYNLDAMAS
jgi:predicted phage terminase large subunit-like protein